MLTLTLEGEAVSQAAHARVAQPRRSPDTDGGAPAASLSMHARCVPASGLVEADIDGARMLFSTRTGRLYRLNASARRAWMALRVVSPASAAAMLSAEFDVPMAQARADVMAFLEQLFDAGLVFPAG